MSPQYEKKQDAIRITRKDTGKMSCRFHPRRGPRCENALRHLGCTLIPPSPVFVPVIWKIRSSRGNTAVDHVTRQRLSIACIERRADIRGRQARPRRVSWPSSAARGNRAAHQGYPQGSNPPPPICATTGDVHSFGLAAPITGISIPDRRKSSSHRSILAMHPRTVPAS
jgi:hypothetical protein